MALAACEPIHPTSQLNWQPPGFAINLPGGEVFRYPNNLEGPTVVLFWATWCPYCKALMPHLQSIVDEHEGRVQVLALNFKDDDDPTAFLAQRRYDFKLILHSEEIAKSWGVKGTPGLFLADKTGRVVFSRAAIPEASYPTNPAEPHHELNNYQKAARQAPDWAATLRVAIDQLLH
jgi:thiol-disulfide isomerase/thioredoxin